MTLVATVLGALAAVLLILLKAARARQRRDELALQEAQRGAAELRLRIDRLEAGLSGAGEGLIILDREGAIVATNQAAVELAQLPVHDSRGRRLRDLVPWQRLHDSIERSRLTGEEVLFELDDALRTGRTLAIRVRSTPGSGCVIGIDDQSRLKRLESLRRDFVANVSHELKTPLAAIQGFVETMLDDPNMPFATRHRFIERIGGQARRLTSLVGDLLTLSRLDEHTGLELPPDPCDLVAVLRDTVRDLGPLAEKRQLRLTALLPERSLFVPADREALRQVSGNLIDNAIKYTPEGGTVTVQIAETGERVLFEVVDTGIGLSQEDQERVFERFYRVDRARSRALGGTGLGLSIVKHLVQAMGGDITVHSEVGRGSTFTFSLPRSEEGETPEIVEVPS
jgi:two-component system phosphate regulon sensor histidine kinase PhoR